MAPKLIATDFSTGSFCNIYPHIADNAVWKIVGESEYIGKKAIIEQCERVGNYFKTVTTSFFLQHVIVDDNKVAVNGTAEFSKNNQRLSFVNACDVYEFDEDNKITNITSYCIPQK